MVIVSDSSPLISLAILGKLDLLVRKWGRIYFRSLLIPTNKQRPESSMILGVSFLSHHPLALPAYIR
ncbi:MAG: hypothetical protein D3916_15295 [Candidatus Electrothrix sp. MAN1_4]|nr:hypothetical protein [Candidatus Electrothrix sp. MAN1_4]